MNGSSARRMPPRAAVLLCAALALLATAPAVTAGTGGTPGPNRADVDAAKSFREKLGFRSDRAFVASTFSIRGFSSEAWGVPLDDAESRELERRTKVQKEIGRALGRWANEPGSAGAYLDQRARGRPVFLTTKDPTNARRAVERMLPDGANARFLRVDHSMAELLAVQERINADLEAGTLRELGVTSTSIDARSNAVVVGVAAASDTVRAAIVARYGGAVTVTAEAPAQGGDACSARDACPPAKAGLEIRSSYNGNICTTGFLVRIAGSPEPRILTAGHCLALSGGTGTSRTWSQPGQQMGWAEFASWADGADADVGVLAPNSSAISGPRNLLYRSSSSDVVPIAGWRSNAAQVQGSVLCRAGAVSNYRCGTIVLTNRTKDVDGQTIDHQWVVDFDACPGDSGGPYFAGTTAYGLHTDSTVGCDPNSNQAWYSPIGWAMDVLASRGHPVELCVSSTCGSDTNMWTQRGSLSNGSWNPHLVTVDGGRVLAVGGTTGDVLVGEGGGSGQEPELFAPATGAWSDAASPPWAPATCSGQFAVKLADGRVLVGGGRNVGSGGGDACAGAHLFDADNGPNGSWSTVAAPPVALEAAGGALLADGRAFITGGSGAAGATSVAMAYSPSGNSWTTLAPAPAGALDPLVLRLPDGRVLVSGGYRIADAGGPGYADVTATHLYNPATNTWASTSAVGARGLAGLVLANGRVMVAGGQHLSWNGSQQGSFVATARSFNPSTNAWSTLAPLRRARAGAALVEMSNGLVMAAGGRVDSTTVSGGATRTAEAFDAATNAWYTAPMLVAAHGDPGGIRLADGRVLVAGGGTTATETYVAGDLQPPTASAPAFGLRTGAAMTTSAIPIRVTFSGSDRGGSGVGTFDVARSIDGNAFTTIATQVTGTSYNTTGSSGHTYRFQVRARDWAGNVGAWVPGSSRRLTALEQTSPKITYSGLWRTDVSSAYSGGSIRYASTGGYSATYRFTGRGIAFVSVRGPTRGSVKVYVDGSLASTVSLYSSVRTNRYVAFQRSWGSSGTHTIKLVVAGTSGRPRFDLDAFEVISSP